MSPKKLTYQEIISYLLMWVVLTVQVLLDGAAWSGYGQINFETMDQLLFAFACGLGIAQPMIYEFCSDRRSDSNERDLGKDLAFVFAGLSILLRLRPLHQSMEKVAVVPLQRIIIVDFVWADILCLITFIRSMKRTRKVERIGPEETQDIELVGATTVATQTEVSMAHATRVNSVPRQTTHQRMFLRCLLTYVFLFITCFYDVVALMGTGVAHHLASEDKEAILVVGDMSLMYVWKLVVGILSISILSTFMTITFLLDFNFERTDKSGAKIVSFATCLLSFTLHIIGDSLVLEMPVAHDTEFHFNLERMSIVFGMCGSVFSTLALLCALSRFLLPDSHIANPVAALCDAPKPQNEIIHPRPSTRTQKKMPLLNGEMKEVRAVIAEGEDEGVMQI